MSGILLPGQDKKPQSSEGEAQSSGLVLPKGFGSHKKENAAPKPVEPAKTAGEQAAPPAANPTASFLFDVPVRFDTDHLQVVSPAYHLQNVQSIPLIEIRA